MVWTLIFVALFNNPAVSSHPGFENPEACIKAAKEMQRMLPYRNTDYACINRMTGDIRK